jgi:hypothetical protein
VDQGAGRVSGDGAGKFFGALIDDLLTFAESEFHLGERAPDGVTYREHYESIVRQGGKVPEPLANAPERPELLLYLWQSFCASTARRTFKHGVPVTISNFELQAWMTLHGTDLLPWEVKVLDSLEQAYVAYHIKKAAAKNGHR